VAGLTGAGDGAGAGDGVGVDGVGVRGGGAAATVYPIHEPSSSYRKIGQDLPSCPYEQREPLPYEQQQRSLAWYVPLCMWMNGLDGTNRANMRVLLEEGKGSSGSPLIQSSIA